MISGMVDLGTPVPYPMPLAIGKDTARPTICDPCPWVVFPDLASENRFNEIADPIKIIDVKNWHIHIQRFIGSDGYESRIVLFSPAYEGTAALFPVHFDFRQFAFLKSFG